MTNDYEALDARIRGAIDSFAPILLEAYSRDRGVDGAGLEITGYPEVEETAADSQPTAASLARTLGFAGTPARTPSRPASTLPSWLPHSGATGTSTPSPWPGGTPCARTTTE